MNKSNKQIEKMPQWAYVIGRFQLPHNSHFSLIEKALLLAHNVLIFVGSANASRSALNPFTATERMSMLSAGFSKEQLARIVFCPIEDFWDNDLWASDLKSKAKNLTQCGEPAILVGHKKDFSSRYLDSLKVKLHDTGPLGDISSTSLRDIFFMEEPVAPTFDVLSSLTRPGVIQYLRAFSHTPSYQWICRDYKATKEYVKRWGKGPHLTADSLVSCAGKVLLVQRGGDIGYEQWALPGGFVEPHEDFLPAAVRELEEETRIAMPPSLLDDYRVSDKVFSHPRRSSRGRIVTRVFHFALPSFETPPEVHAADDAKDCKWTAIEDIRAMREMMFEDHYHIIDSFLKLNGR